jgi:formate hydrogenlyase transcriptional activator
MSTMVAVQEVIQAERVEALLRASNAISCAHDAQSFEEIFVRELRGIVSFDCLHLVKFDQHTHAVERRLFKTAGTCSVPPIEVPIEETTGAWVDRNGEPLVIADWKQETRFPKMKELMESVGIASSCSLPLIRSNRRLGVMELGSYERNAYSARELAFLSLLADQVALVIDAALNFMASQLAEERLKLLLELTNSVVSNLESRDLLRAITASVRRVMQCHGVGVALPHPDGKNLRVYALDVPEDSDFKEDTLIPIEGNALCDPFRTGTPVIINSTDPHESAPHSKAVIPLLCRNRILGLLMLGKHEENAFHQEDLEFLTQIANQIAIAVENALAYQEIANLKDKLAQEKLYLEDEIRDEFDFEEIVGHNSGLRHVLQLVETVAPSDSTVLLLGETGTGKEVIARAIHENSRRNGRIFVKLNCAAIPTGLLESELFGHEKGAFTGAIAQKIGRLELADEGTLFLDEIGDIPLEIQPKLLRALQEREFERLGSTRTKKVNVRLIAATNRDLEAMIENREFRSDLYYRLNVFPIRIPPLRDRTEDIPLLVRYFTQKYARRMQKRIETIPTAALAKLARYRWPGNVRELENFIERAVILTRGSALDVPDLELGKTAPATSPAFDRDTQDRDEILRVLKETNGRVGGDLGAATRLGLKRTTLISRMKKLGIDPRRVF